MARPRLLALGALAALLLAAAGGWLALRDRGLPAPDPPAALAPDAPDPFAYSDARRAEFEERAAAGFAHVVYAKSPGGVVATAARVAAYRDRIERVAQDAARARRNARGDRVPGERRAGRRRRRIRSSRGRSA